MSTHTTTPPTERATRRTAPWPAALAVVAVAVATAVALRLIAYATGIDLVVETGDDHTTVRMAPVIAGSAIGALAGVLVLQLALRYVAHGRRWWTVGSAVSLFGSLTTPMASTTASAWIVLSLMHLVVGAVVIVGLRRVAPREVA